MTVSTFEQAFSVGRCHNGENVEHGGEESNVRVKDTHRC